MRARRVVWWVAVLVLLLPAIALTLNRIVEPDVGPGIRAEAFTPLAGVLYAAALLVTGVRLLVARRWRSAVPAVLAVCVLGLGLHCWWYAPQVTGADPPPADGVEPLTVMTVNVAQGSGDVIEVVREVSEERVALLVVEEITAADLSDMERSGIDDLLPHRIGEPKSFGDGTMVFSRDALGTPERIATLHDSWVVEVGDLTVVAVHPYAPTQPWAWRQDHDRIASAVAAAEPDLVLGDFNATADHAPMRALSDAGYRDVGELTNAGWQPTWPSSGVARLLGLTLPPVAQIDHVLVGPRLAALSARTIDVPGSDHRAVLARVARK